MSPWGYSPTGRIPAAIRALYDANSPGLVEASYTALIDWALDIGAKDMTEPADPAALASQPVERVRRRRYHPTSFIDRLVQP